VTPEAAALLAAVLSVVGAPSSRQAPPRPAPAAPAGALPPAKQKAIEDVADAWFAARPATALEDWDAAKRAELLERAKALDPIPKSAIAEIRSLLWKTACKHGPQLAKTTGGIETSSGRSDYVVKNAGPGRGLLIGLHDDPGMGGMNDAASKWAPALAKAKLAGIFPSGIVKDRDAWGLPGAERVLLTLVEQAKRTLEIDPDRVFVAGFGSGGAGTWFLAGRHADLFAGALPFHGRIIAEYEDGKLKRLHHGLLPNLRVVPLYFTTGARDSTYPPETSLEADKVLAELRKEALGGYEVNHKHLPDAGHEFVPSEPAGAAAWMASKKRSTFPKAITWEVTLDPIPQGPDRIVTRDFYWLRCEAPTDAMRVDAEVKTHSVTVRVERHDPKGLTVFLSPDLLDVDQPVQVYVNGETRWNGVLEPSFSAMLESMSARMDRSMVFDRRVDL